MKELSKEQIEMEAEEWVQSNPSGYGDFNMNDAMNMGKNKGYVAAAIKYIGNTRFLRNEISDLIEQNNELGFKVQALWLRIKELEDGLRKAVEVIKVWHQADEVWDIYFNNAPEMKPIKQLLTNK